MKLVGNYFMVIKKSWLVVYCEVLLIVRFHLQLMLCAFVAVAGVVVDALAAPKIAQDAQEVQLLRYVSNNDGLGIYNFA